MFRLSRNSLAVESSIILISEKPGTSFEFPARDNRFSPGPYKAFVGSIENIHTEERSMYQKYSKYQPSFLKN